MLSFVFSWIQSQALTSFKTTKSSSYHWTKIL